MLAAYYSLSFLHQNQCRQEFGHDYRLCYSQDPREICHALWCADRHHGAECRTKKGMLAALAAAAVVVVVVTLSSARIVIMAPNVRPKKVS